MFIYIDNEFKCHAENTSNFQAVEDSFFDNKCKIFIEGYRFIPENEMWINPDGIEFRGKMIAPHKNYIELERAQLTYEKEQAEEVARILLGE